MSWNSLRSTEAADYLAELGASRFSAPGQPISAPPSRPWPPKELAHSIAERLNRAGLWVSAWPLTDPAERVRAVCVTDSDEPTTAVIPTGTSDPEPRGYQPYDDNSLAQRISDDILALHEQEPDVQRSWHLMITDPRWNRARHLWDALADALNLTASTPKKLS